MELAKRIGRSGAQRDMSFVEHLNVFRGHLFKSAIAVAIGAIIVAIYNSFIFKRVLMGPTHPDFVTYGILRRLSTALGMGSHFNMNAINVKFQSNTVGGQFDVYFNVILIGGFILAFPYVLWQFWQFAKPALNPKEIKSTRGVIFWVSLLFFGGVFFGFFLIAPYTISFFSKFSLDDNIENIWTVNSYFSTLVPLILGAGLAFQLPLILYFLGRVGVVSAKYLRKGRRYAILIMLILSGIITPPDMLSQIVCTIPLILLYETGILLCAKAGKRAMQHAV